MLFVTSTPFCIETATLWETNDFEGGVNGLESDGLSVPDEPL